MTGSNPGSDPDPWQSILNPDEVILWQGRPDGAVALSQGNIIALTFGIGFAGSALFWMITVSWKKDYSWIFGLPYFTAGLGLAFGAIFWGAWKRQHTWYTLSNRRAFIATNLPLHGRRLKSYRITSKTVLNFDKGALSTIYFDFEFRRTKHGSRRIDIGLERIGDGDKVHRLMREIRKGDR